MIDFFVAPLEYGFMVRALIGSVLVGVMCPLVGAYVVTRNLAFMGDALAHAVLPGMVLGFIVGFNPAIAAVPTGVSVAMLVRIISRRAGLSTDTSIGILFAAMFALGLVMLARATRATQIGVNLEDLLLGQISGHISDRHLCIPWDNRDSHPGPVRSSPLAAVLELRSRGVPGCR